ncbi:hypothetical protein Tco_0477619 [Tanacetum coccineum]
MELHVVSYGIDNGLEVGSIRRIQGLDMAYWGFLRVGTTFDIFQNIHILYLQYGVLTSSGYGVLSFIPLWSLVSAGTDTPSSSIPADYVSAGHVLVPADRTLVFNTRRQQTEETFYITFDESTYAIKFSKPSVDNITIAENIFITLNLLKGARMLIRAKAKELSVASAHECLFVDFLSEEEPKKVLRAVSSQTMFANWTKPFMDLNKLQEHGSTEEVTVAAKKQGCRSLVLGAIKPSIGCGLRLGLAQVLRILNWKDITNQKGQGTWWNEEMKAKIVRGAVIQTYRRRSEVQALLEVLPKAVKTRMLKEPIGLQFLLRSWKLGAVVYDVPKTTEAVADSQMLLDSGFRNFQVGFVAETGPFGTDQWPVARLAYLHAQSYWSLEWLMKTTEAVADSQMLLDSGFRNFVLRWGRNGCLYVLKRGLKGGVFGVETVAKMDLIMYNQQLEAIKRELTQVGAPIFGQVKDETTKSQDSVHEARGESNQWSDCIRLPGVKRSRNAQWRMRKGRFSRKLSTIAWLKKHSKGGNNNGDV